MKNSPIYLLAALVAIATASPVPAIEWVTVTAYTTMLIGGEKAEQTSNIESVATTEIPTVPSSIEENKNSKSVLDAFVVTSSAADNGATTSASTAEIETVSASTAAMNSEPASTSATTTSSSGPSGSFSGEGTYYDTGLGSCGITSTDNDYIVAISHELYDKYTPNGNPNHNTLCGKKIKASYEGNTVEVTVVDRCEGCSYYDLDFSPSAFSDLASKGLGRIDINWDWA